MEENKKSKEAVDDRKMKMFQGFAQMMDAVWENDSGTKGLEKFLKQNDSVLEDKEGEKQSITSEYRAIYKCRLCGGKFESAAVKGAEIAIKHMLIVTTGYTPAEYIGTPITETSMHSCKGGSMGLADFIGFRKVVD